MTGSWFKKPKTKECLMKRVSKTHAIGDGYALETRARSRRVQTDSDGQEVVNRRETSKRHKRWQVRELGPDAQRSVDQGEVSDDHRHKIVEQQTTCLKGQLVEDMLTTW